MPFLADAMLGKLARWLRILGFDTVYLPSLTDEDILERARAEDRIILTRDSSLHKKALRSGVQSFLIKQNENLGMLQEMSPLLTECPHESRCPACNTLLALSDPHLHDDLTQDQNRPLWHCPSCGKLYWHGAHWKGIKTILVLAGLGDRIGNSQ